MPTTAIPEIFTPHRPGSELDGLLHRLSLGIGETLAQGTHILLWSANCSEGDVDEIPILLLFRHALETVDAISCLIRQGAVEACKMLLRGLFESLLSCEYILKQDSQRRALCFMVGYLHWEVGMSRRLDSSSAQGRKFRRRINKDKVLRGLKLPVSADGDERKKQLQLLLEHPRLQTVEEEFSRLKQRTNRTPIWYSMFDGPRNLETLAAQVELPGLYDFLYRRWSASVHGLEVFEGKLLGRDGTKYITQLRAVDNLQQVTQHTLWLTIQLFQTYVNKRLPDFMPMLNQWFMREMKDLFEELSGAPLVSIQSIYHEESSSENYHG